jgi:hypothetical protein
VPTKSKSWGQSSAAMHVSYHYVRGCEIFREIILSKRREAVQFVEITQSALSNW